MFEDLKKEIIRENPPPKTDLDSSFVGWFQSIKNTDSFDNLYSVIQWILTLSQFTNEEKQILNNEMVKRLKNIMKDKYDIKVMSNVELTKKIMDMEEEINKLNLKIDKLSINNQE